MNSTEIRDPLFDFELMVARRADELSHDPAMQGRNALEVWCEAERLTRSPFEEHVGSVDFSLSK